MKIEINPHGALTIIIKMSGRNHNLKKIQKLFKCFPYNLYMDKKLVDEKFKPYSDYITSLLEWTTQSTKKLNKIQHDIDNITIKFHTVADSISKKEKIDIKQLKRG